MTLRRGVAPLLVGMAGLLAACSSTGTAAPRTTTATAPTTTAPTTTSAPTPATTATTAAPTAPAGPAPVYEVRTGTVPGLGKVLVDGQGFTLYLFVPDKRSNRSTCYSLCAKGWPPLLLPTGVTTPVAGSGADAALLGTTSRTDGTTQLTYDSWPLYLWVNDSQPGQATGQGLNNLGGLWYVLAPNGSPITAKP